MARFIWDFDIPGVSEAEAEELVAEVEVKACRRVPALAAVTDPDVLTAIGSALKRIVRQWVANAEGRVTMTVAGPFTSAYASRVVGGGEFTPGELAELRGLAGAPARPAGLPRGEFPRPPLAGCLFNRQKAGV
jgi:hypothetical protein